ncbi:hypothetical protein M758_UG001500 [Ceratodon purpureus]|nr:hypothetical protein M758_UG001500 [Ceratodon purpureus]
MARGLTCEITRKKKMNWAAYGEWTNTEEYRRKHKGVSGLSCISDQREDAVLEAEGAQAMPWGVEGVTQEMLEYKDHIEGMLKDTEVALQDLVKARDAKAMADVLQKGRWTTAPTCFWKRRRSSRCSFTC